MEAAPGCPRLWVELPAHCAGFRVQSYHAIGRGREVQDSIDYNRSALKSGCATPCLAQSQRDFPCAKGPGALELRHGAPIDLIQRGVPHAARIIAVRAPFIARG